MTARPTALIADDEPLLRDALQRRLADAWPELKVVAQARNGREAIAQFETHRPDVCFLDVQMPGITGVQAAHRIGQRAHVVFVTAYEHYAVQAFAAGVLDYLVKPVEAARLADTVARLKGRLHAAQPASNTDEVLRGLLARLQPDTAAAPLRWIRAQVGQALRMIAVDDVDYLKSEAKYTLIAWHGDDGRNGEALIGTPLKDLIAQLDPTCFVQVHRSAVVNLRSISHVLRGDNETASIHLKGRQDILPVSRNYLHLFRTM